MNAKPVTASTVRAYFQGDAKRLVGLTAEAEATVVKGARGRLSPLAVKRFNAKRPESRRYVLGATGAAKAAKAAQRDNLRAAGVAIGARGPLPKAAKVSLSTSKA